MLAIDLAKDNFQFYGVIKNGKPQLNKSIRRSNLLKTTSQLQPLTIVLEACGGANYWSRRFTEQGHEVKIISPQHVKPFVGTQKNDRKDAMAIYEAAQRLDMKFVAPKTVEQQDVQSMHRIRERLVKQKTMITNQTRGLLLEYGIAISLGIRNFTKELPLILEDANNELTEIIRGLVSDLYDEFKSISTRLEKITFQIETFSKQNETCLALQKLRGVGPITASAFWMCIGNAGVFKNGRSVSAWLGLVPRQHSSGGKQKLLGITKRGDSYLRRLLVIAGRAQVNAAKRKIYKSDDDIKILTLVEQKGCNKACVALANKLGRHMWATMASL